MQLLNKLQGEYDQLWKHIIRPARTPYPQSALGPETFCLQNIKIKRNSFQLINDRGQVFFASHFVPLESTNYPCVIYLHGNSSNQTEGMEYLSALIKNNISLCTFDFAACGNSEGQYVTLGYNQWRDVEEVVAHIKAKQKVTKIALWGRSMGAVTALRYVAQRPDIAVAIYDSPFKSLKTLIEDLCKKNTKIPMFILSGALKIIGSTIKQKANFDIYALNPLKNEVPTIKVPGFFIVSEQDQLIPYEHTKTIFEAYKSKKKQIRIVKGEHNGVRPENCINDAIKYLKKYLFKQDKKQLKSPQKGTKAEDIDFFNEDLLADSTQPEKPVNISNQIQQQTNVDFFAEPNQDDFKQFENAMQKSGKTQENSSSSLFSLNDIFAGVFGSKQKKPKQINDGYEQLRSKFSQTIANVIAISQNAQRKQIQDQIQKQLKNRDDGFQKLFSIDPQQYVW